MTLFSHFLFRFHLKAAALIASIKNFCDSGDLDGLRSVVTSGKILKLGVNDANQVGLDCDTNSPPKFPFRPPSLSGDPSGRQGH